MKPTNIFFTILAVTLIFLFCAQPGGPRSVLAAAKPLTADHPLKVKHTYDSDTNVVWGIKENGKRAFHLKVPTNQTTIEWQNVSKETNMSIIVNNTSDWKETFTAPTYGPGCTTCGQIDTTNGIIRLTFVGSKGTNSFYQIVVPDQAKTHKRDTPVDYDYDMVDATVVWSDTLKGKKGNGS
jgi:hypothetical protein